MLSVPHLSDPQSLVTAMATPVLDEASPQDQQRPALVTHISSPVDPWKSPLRHHRRTPSVGRPPIKETLDASLSYDEDEDGGQEMRINQYVLKQEIGRGSFGAVHLAVDTDGNKYAVKEFSKSRLRKRSQSNILRRPHAAARRGGLLNSPFHRRSASDIHKEQEGGNPLYLIREEIAILKKLDHENVVTLFEVLDDPEGDSLYMVLEMCEKGVIMKVGLDDTATPYPEEKCRMWFRDMILGIEYLHAQGIVHRDIKPDNLLLSKDEVLKIVDFGVSEIFEKKTAMMTAKSAGSPAFLPPELCHAKHGDISGTAADIWSMGVTLYCLLFGRLPFMHHGVMELYNAIRFEDLPISPDTNPHLKDLLLKLFEKDPYKRIKMPELREHPWVTRNGEDKLLSFEENTAAEFIEPTEEEMASAITKNMRSVLTVVKAVRKLKRLTLGRYKSPVDCRPTLTTADYVPRRTKSADIEGRRPFHQMLSSFGIQSDISLKSVAQALPHTVKREVEAVTHHHKSEEPPTAEKVQENDNEYPRIQVAEYDNANGISNPNSPLDEEPRYLNVGTGSDSESRAPPVVCESPQPTDDHIMEEAWREDAERIQREHGPSATVYSTKWVDQD